MFTFFPSGHGCFFSNQSRGMAESSCIYATVWFFPRVHSNYGPCRLLYVQGRFPAWKSASSFDGTSGTSSSKSTCQACWSWSSRGSPSGSTSKRHQLVSQSASSPSSRPPPRAPKRRPPCRGCHTSRPSIFGCPSASFSSSPPCSSTPLSTSSRGGGSYDEQLTMHRPTLPPPMLLLLLLLLLLLPHPVVPRRDLTCFRSENSTYEPSLIRFVRLIVNNLILIAFNFIFNNLWWPLRHWRIKTGDAAWTNRSNRRIFLREIVRTYRLNFNQWLVRHKTFDTNSYLMPLNPPIKLLFRSFSVLLPHLKHNWGTSPGQILGDGEWTISISSSVI